MSYPLQILPSRRSVITLVQAVHIWWLRTSYSNSAEEVNYSVMEMSEPLHADKRNSTFTSVEEDDEPHDFLVFDRHLSGGWCYIDKLEYNCPNWLLCGCCIIKQLGGLYFVWG